MGSTRLPGKVLLPLGGTTVLGCVIERLAVAQRVDAIAVATSTLRQDDAVVREAQRLGALVHRGSASDVLARFAGAAQETNAAVVVRVTADCPLIDGALIDRMLESFESEPCDYLSNVMPRTFARGLDAEIFTRDTLEVVRERARQQYEREHVTPYIYEHPDEFSLRGFVDKSGADRSNLRWTLDTEQDFEFLQAVYAAFASVGPSAVATADVIALLERRPELLALNAAVKQKSLSG